MSPQQGLLFYNTSSRALEFFDGTDWRTLSPAP